MKKFPLCRNCILFSLLAISISACNKQQLVVDSEPHQAYFNGIPIDIEEGMLHFADKDDFHRAVLTNNNYDQVVSFAWEKENGFTSMWRNFVEFHLEVDQLKEKSDYNQAMLQRKGQFIEHERGIFYPLMRSRSFSRLLDWEGKVLIGEHLYVFQDTHQFLVKDKDLNKLKLAMQTLQSDEVAGVYVIPQPKAGLLEQRDVTIVFGNCPTQNISATDFTHDNAKKIESDLFSYNSCFFTGNNFWHCDQYVIHDFYSYKKNGAAFFLEKIDSYMDSDGEAFPVGPCSVFQPANPGTKRVFSESSTSTNTFADETVADLGYTLNADPCTNTFDIPTSVGSTYVDRTNDGDYGEATDDLQIKIFCN